MCAERSENNTTPHHHIIIGVILGIIAAFGQGFGAVLMKIGTQGLNAFEATNIRVIAGVAGFVVAVPVMRRTSDVRNATRNPRAMMFLTLGAIAGPVCGVSSYNFAISMIPVGIVGTLAAMVPVVVLPFCGDCEERAGIPAGHRGRGCRCHGCGIAVSMIQVQHRVHRGRGEHRGKLKSSSLCALCPQ